MEKTKILIVGKNSFICNGILDVPDGDVSIWTIGHDDLINFRIDTFDVVINCAIAPEYKTKKYTIFNDMDARVATYAASAGAHYIMLSTRKVYGNSKELVKFTEDSPVNPFDYYSENKLKSEEYVSQTCDSYSIIRGSNLFGFELNRNSFLGYCLDALKWQGNINFTLNRHVVRDFIDINTSAEILLEVAKQQPNGVFNMGSNHGLEIGKIAEYLIEGYGFGTITQTSDEYSEQFVLDNSKIKATLGVNIGPINFKKILNDIGKKL